MDGSIENFNDDEIVSTVTTIGSQTVKGTINGVQENR